MTTFPVAAHCFASSHTDASPLASVITGRRSVTNPGSLIGAANTKPFVLKYTVWPDIGWRFPSRSWTVSGGLNVESTVSDRPAPDTMFRPAPGPLVSPHANAKAGPPHAMITRTLRIDPTSLTRAR